MVTPPNTSRDPDLCFGVFWKILCSTTLMQSFMGLTGSGFITGAFRPPPPFSLGYLCQKYPDWLGLKVLHKMCVFSVLYIIVASAVLTKASLLPKNTARVDDYFWKRIIILCAFSISHSTLSVILKYNLTCSPCKA